MASIWILDRDEQHRSALGRLIGVGTAALVGAPGDEVFETATGARAVVLGLGEDLERELEFAHRTAARLDDCTWILIPRAHEPDLVRVLFDALDTRVLKPPVGAERLRSELREVLARREGLDPLSLRRTRDTLADRFARSFADLDLPELLRAMDPRLARIPLLVRGEPGTGRKLLAHYVHTFGGDAAGGAMPFVELDCASARSVDDLLAPLFSAPRARAATILLADIDQLAVALQPTLRSWIEYGLPAGTSPAAHLRFAATLGDDGASERLDPALASALAGVTIRIPPLRERSTGVAALAREITSAWCHRYGQSARELAPDALAALESHDWPGNLPELEAVLARALAAHGSNPLRATHLRLDAGPVGEALPLLLAVEELPEDVVPSHESLLAEAASDGLADDEGEAVIDLSLDALLPDETEAALSAPDFAPDIEAGDPYEREHRAALGLPAEPAPAERPAAEPPRAASPGATERERSWYRLADAVAGELRAPLTTIRNFSELFDDHYGDPEFRARYAELVGADLRRIDDVVERLELLGRTSEAAGEVLDVSELIETLLVERREAIAGRRLLVLKELDRHRPLAIASPLHLRFILDGLLEMLLRRVPEGGDVYIASHYSEDGLAGKPAVRVLLRFRRPVQSPASTEPNPPLALALAIGEAAMTGMSGRFATSETANETVVVLDLPAPA